MRIPTMQPSCSVFLLRPLMEHHAVQTSECDLVPGYIRALPIGARVPVTTTLAFLDAAVDRLKDPALGVKLGHSLYFGAGGPFDYTVRSARTVSDAVGVASKYARLLTDSFTVTLETWKRQKVIRLEGDAPWMRAAADFSLRALYRVHVADLLRTCRVECWFPYRPPPDTSAYERAFDGAVLRFAMPCFAFAFDERLAEMPIPGADPIVHAVLRARVDQIMQELSAARPFAHLVRSVIGREVAGGVPTILHVARALAVSQRSLCRRLAEEKTSFSEVVDDVRRELALAHVRNESMPLSEVAFASGFSHIESFHRAFVRWNGETPARYRRAAASEPSFREDVRPELTPGLVKRPSVSAQCRSFRTRRRGTAPV